MRYLTIPKDADTTGIATNDDGSPANSMSFSVFFVETVVPRMPKKDAAQVGLFRSLAAKLPEAKAGDIVGLTDAEHEALSSALPQKINGQVALRIIDFFECVATASPNEPSVD